MPDTPPAQAWLFLSPFGQEAIRATPMYRSLADRLSRNGAAVLRFDYHGTGDSEGESGEQTLDDWIEDTRHAIRTFHSIARTPRINLFGVGLGATLGALAAARDSTGLGSLILWEPVVNGTYYLKTLMGTHRREVARAFDMTWAEVREELAEPEPILPGNLLGFDLGRRLVEQIEALKTLPIEQLAVRGVQTTVALADEHLRDPLEQTSQMSLLEVAAPTDWMANEALGTALVPQQLIALMDRLSCPA